MRALVLCIAGWTASMSFVLAQAPAVVAPKAVTRAQVTGDIVSAKVERLADQRATLTIELRPEANLRLLDASWKEIPAARGPGGALKADVDPKQGYVLAPREAPARRALPKDGLSFPARYVTLTPAGASRLGGLFLRPAVVPLTWNEEARAYATEILVGYEFDDGGERTLAAPKTVTFFAEGANARIRDERVTVTESGTKGYQRVTLSTGQVDGETHFIARAGAADELKVSVSVQRELGALTLSLPSTELPAFGVGSGVLTVGLLGRDGMPLIAAKAVEVQLSSRRLRQPAVLTIEPGRSTATVDVRTAGYGSDRIEAHTGSLRAALPIELVFPVAATVAALAGGALGGTARYLRNKRKRGPLLARRVAEGMIVGLIIVGAAWTGLVSVDLSTGILGTPFGAFVLAALAGYLGCVLLDRVAKKTFGGEKAET